MLVKAAGILGLGVAALALAGCGSASYSVAQVESAFGAHGIVLAQTVQQETRGVVELSNLPDRVLVLVRLSGGGGITFTVGWNFGRRSSEFRQGNLVVWATPAHRDAVKAALRQLRQ